MRFFNGKFPTSAFGNFTEFELKNIVRNEDWLNNTIFYRDGKSFTIQNDADELLKKFGIKLF